MTLWRCCLETVTIQLITISVNQSKNMILSWTSAFLSFGWSAVVKLLWVLRCKGFLHRAAGNPRRGLTSAVYVQSGSPTMVQVVSKGAQNNYNLKLSNDNWPLRAGMGWKAKKQKKTQKCKLKLLSPNWNFLKQNCNREHLNNSWENSEVNDE